MSEKKPPKKWAKKFYETINIILCKEKLDKKSVDVINYYAKTWRLLSAYDENRLVLPNTVFETNVILDYEMAIRAIDNLKRDLMSKKDASALFAQEHDHQLKGILDNIHQTFGDELLYRSCEERAAYLLYFVIKDRPFMSGNKRIGSLLFVRYLRENNFDTSLISESTLSLLALYVASSQSGEKDQMIKLIVNLITKD